MSNLPTPNRVTLMYLQGTPVFAVKSSDAEYNRVYGSLYLPEQGMFVFPAFYPFHRMIVDDFTVLDVRSELDASALAWVAEQDTFESKIKDRVWAPEFKFPVTPYDHQLDAFSFAIRNLRCGLFLEMGLGKTAVATHVIRYFKQFGTDRERDKKTLVVVPKVILHKWAKEVDFHSGGDLKPVILDGTAKRRSKRMLLPGDVFICTYGAATAMAEELAEHLDYGTIVVDESHNLQSHDSSKTKAVTYLSRKAPRRIIMSGTTSLGDPRHLWGQLDVMGPFLHEENYWKFCWRYVSYADQQRRIVTGFKNLDVLQRRMNFIGIRKTKDECLDLPERTFVTLPYMPEKVQRDTYNDLVASDKAELEAKLNITEEATPAARLIKLTQVLSGFIVQSNKNPRICDECKHVRVCVSNEFKPYTKNCLVETVAPESTLIRLGKNTKLDMLKELVETALAEPTNKLVIWAHYLQELTDLEVAMDELGVQHVRVDGGISAREMKTRVDRFQTDPECRVYIAQVATGVGIELTAANLMVFYSLDWNLGTYLQALDRAHRIGQLRNVTVYVFLATGAVDEAIYDALQNKQDISSALIDTAWENQTDFERRVTRPTFI